MQLGIPIIYSLVKLYAASRRPCSSVWSYWHWNFSGKFQMNSLELFLFHCQDTFNEHFAEFENIYIYYQVLMSSWDLFQGEKIEKKTALTKTNYDSICFPRKNLPVPFVYDIRKWWKNHFFQIVTSPAEIQSGRKALPGPRVILDRSRNARGADVTGRGRKPDMPGKIRLKKIPQFLAKIL